MGVGGEGSQVPYQLRYAAQLGLFVKMAEKRRVWVLRGEGGQSGALPIALCGPAWSLCKNGRETCVGVEGGGGVIHISHTLDKIS